MAQIMYPDIGASFREGQAFGLQQRLIRDQDQRRNRLAELSAQAYSAAPDQQQNLLGQIAAVSPEAAYKQQEQFQGQEDRRLQKLGGAARYLEQARQSGDPAKIQGAWTAVRPMLQREFPQGQFGDRWDDATMAPALYQALAATGGGGVGNVQSVRVGEDGYYYNVMRDGRVVNTGIKSSPTIKVLEQEGQVPLGVVTSGGVAGSTVQIGGQPASAQSAPAGTPRGASVQAHSDMIASAADAMSKAGVPAEVIDQWIVGQTQGRVDEAPAAQVSAPAPAAPTAPVRTPTAAETAAAVQNAKNEADLKAYRERVPLEVETAGAVEAAKAKAKTQAEVAAQQGTRARDARQVLTLLDEAERLIPQATGSSAGALADQIAGAAGYATQGSKATAALRTIAGQLTSKQPRMEGPQSNADVEMYKQMAGDLANPNLPREQRLAAAKQIRRLAQKYAAQNSAGSAAGGGAARPQTAADFAALPSGALYIDPDDGRTYRKP